MGIGNSLQLLGCFLEKCERRPGIDVRDSDIHIADSEARAELEVALETDQQNPSGTAVAIRDSSVDTDGTIDLTLESNGPLIPPHSETVEIELNGVTLSSTPTAAVTARAPIETTDGGVSSADHDTDVPLFRDTERLSEIYASCETFEEMADAVEMDVSDETVRRYMIRHDIHDPDSYDTGEADSGTEPETTTLEAPSVDSNVGEDATPPVRTDGIGLPESVTTDDLVEAVDNASTIREVGRQLSIDHMDAFELLTELDLLEFVMGRLTPDEDREDGREEILDRLRETAARR
jgi:hypothetical protein